ncbi:unnamed protein product [Effrenium voratum]|uniref:Uncharacterized protein n=1 Tax=Effrenium voratum TaxID=2562239 RepID=A0AA36IDR8_9DINO|nr:unnamed protein product [Effrenium voratum]CAJ1426162.1 unnamed protein product [Effrenium voratum]
MGKRSRSPSREQELSAEGQLTLLQVDYEVLKVENRELRKRLLRHLRKPKGKTEKATPVKAKEKPKEEKKAKKPEKQDKREKPQKREKPEKREKLGKTSDEPKPKAPKEAESVPEAEAEPDTNAVLLANAQMEAYNEPIPNDLPKEKRSPLVEAKLKRFLESFHDGVQIIDLKSGGVVLKDKKMFQKRFACVFRESGTGLRGTCLKRFYFDSKSPTYCLDFEDHESLVTAMAGTPPDGRLGVREPREERLVVLYEEKGGKITRMWLRQDTENLGLDPKAGEEVLAKSEVYKQFEEKLEELKGGDLGERIFHNYYDMPSVG